MRCPVRHSSAGGGQKEILPSCAAGGTCALVPAQHGLAWNLRARKLCDHPSAHESAGAAACHHLERNAASSVGFSLFCRRAHVALDRSVEPPGLLADMEETSYTPPHPQPAFHPAHRNSPAVFLWEQLFSQPSFRNHSLPGHLVHPAIPGTIN